MAVHCADMQWRWNERKSGRACVRHFALLKIFVVVPIHSTSTISLLVSTFVVVSTVWSVSCLLFFYPDPAICKRGEGGGHVTPRALWSRRSCQHAHSFINKSNCQLVPCFMHIKDIKKIFTDNQQHFTHVLITMSLSNTIVGMSNRPNQKLGQPYT